MEAKIMNTNETALAIQRSLDPDSYREHKRMVVTEESNWIWSHIGELESEGFFEPTTEELEKETEQLFSVDHTSERELELLEQNTGLLKENESLIDGALLGSVAFQLLTKLVHSIDAHGIDVEGEWDELEQEEYQKAVNLIKTKKL